MEMEPRGGEGGLANAGPKVQQPDSSSAKKMRPPQINDYFWGLAVILGGAGKGVSMRLSTLFVTI